MQPMTTEDKIIRFCVLLIWVSTIPMIVCFPNFTNYVFKGIGLAVLLFLIYIILYILYACLVFVVSVIESARTPFRKKIWGLIGRFFMYLLLFSCLLFPIFDGGFPEIQIDESLAIFFFIIAMGVGAISETLDFLKS